MNQPNTYSQIYTQIVFAVQNKKSLIQSKWEDRLYKYIIGVVENQNQKMISINGTSDHLHIFIGMKPSCRLSDLVREIKKTSNIFINSNYLANGKFEWQNGYGAFSYHQSFINKVDAYIQKQKEHHKKITFKEEYIAFLEKFQIPNSSEYHFNFNIE